MARRSVIWIEEYLQFCNPDKTEKLFRILTHFHHTRAINYSSFEGKSKARKKNPKNCDIKNLSFPRPAHHRRTHFRPDIKEKLFAPVLIFPTPRKTTRTHFPHPIRARCRGQKPARCFSQWFISQIYDLFRLLVMLVFFLSLFLGFESNLLPSLRKKRINYASA